MTGDGLTAGQVARRLGVAVTTLRSWHRRYGIGPTQHAAGHHRRYAAEDLARLERMHTLTSRGVPTAEAARLVLAGQAEPRPARAGGGAHALPAGRDAGPGVRGLAAAALRLDANTTRRLLQDSLAAGGVVTTWDELVRPVLAGVAIKQGGRHGHRAAGGLVDVEHLLSRCVSEVLATVPRPAAPPRVLLACADEEQHSLPLEALAAALAERGRGVRLLGARVPLPALHAAIRRTGPALVVIWSHATTTAATGQLAELLAGRPRPWTLAAAGPGWHGSELPGGIATPASLIEAVDLAVALTR